MIRGAKTCWKAIQVRGPGVGRGELRDLDASERLAALYRFQNGQAEGHRFLRHVDGHRRAEVSLPPAGPGGGRPPTPPGPAGWLEVTDPADVDWETFPLLAALEAVTHDELRRLHSLFSGAQVSSPARPPRGP
jgi:hypothetical protein